MSDDAATYYLHKVLLSNTKQIVHVIANGINLFNWFRSYIIQRCTLYISLVVSELHSIILPSIVA